MTPLILRADALPGLLDGWVGPVVTKDETLADTVRFSDWVPPDHRVYTSNLGLCGLPVAHLSLDLSLPECRDRVARVLARAVGLECGSTAPTFSLGWRPTPRWCLIISTRRRGQFLRSKEDPRSFVPSLVVPSLSTLNPSSPDLLPDGSRKVDAMALKLVAEHVGAK